MFHFTDQLVCLDHSYARIGRMLKVMRTYLPSSGYLQEGGKAKIIHSDAISYCTKSKPEELYDRVGAYSSFFLLIVALFFVLFLFLGSCGCSLFC
jgi:hypothetical protein